MTEQTGKVKIVIGKISSDGVYLKAVTDLDGERIESQMIGPYKKGDALELDVELSAILIVHEHRKSG